jgi:hypothetical protein
MAEKVGRAPSIRYLVHVPKTAPAGLVVVHNHVQPQPILGKNGFRAWLQPHDETIEVCPCEWAPHLGVHYRAAKQ